MDDRLLQSIRAKLNRATKGFVSHFANPLQTTINTQRAVGQQIQSRVPQSVQQPIQNTLQNVRQGVQNTADTLRYQQSQGVYAPPTGEAIVPDLIRRSSFADTQAGKLALNIFGDSDEVRSATEKIRNRQQITPKERELLNQQQIFTVADVSPSPKGKFNISGQADVGKKTSQLVASVGEGIENIASNFRMDQKTLDEAVTFQNVLRNPDEFVDRNYNFTNPVARQETIDRLTKWAKEGADRIVTEYAPNRDLVNLHKKGGDYVKTIDKLLDLNRENKLAKVGMGFAETSSKTPKGQPLDTGLKISQETPLSGIQKNLGSTRDVLGQKLKSVEGRGQTLLQESKLKSDLVENSRPLDNIVRDSNINVKEKVGVLDYLRTPDRVLKKIGLGKEATKIRSAYDNYLKELPEEINKITEWSRQVPPESNQKIFKHLDGQDIQLNPQEQKVANEIQEYLAGWADRLNLPKDKRIANYITHIFEQDFIEKEFDPDIAKLIRDKVAGSVYDPFLEKRLGKLGYVEDTWRALDAYVKRATRKANMDSALSDVRKAAENLEQSQYDYVKNYTDRINLRPTNLDNLLDNTLKQAFGYRLGQRPVASLTRTGRQMVYRGALGLNVGSALKNLSQGANTYAKLGEKYTVKGYWDLLVKGTDELEQVGVLRNDFIQDRVLSSRKQTLQKLDSGLFFMFELAEKINRGSAYYGAKAKALSKGMSEEKAIEFAKGIVRDTQFTFGSVDTPVGMQSDIAKLLTQFQSYTLKQGEFLGEMIKNKEFAGLARYTASALGFTLTVGKLMGMEPKDLIPSVRFGTPPAVDPAIEIGKAALNVEDKYGNVPDNEQKLENILGSLVKFVPGGVQFKKTGQGLADVSRGYSETSSGRIRFPIDQSANNYVRAGLFGPFNLGEAQDYFDEDRSPLGDKQSGIFKALPDQQRVQFYQDVLSKRKQGDVVEKAKDDIDKIAQGGDLRVITDSESIDINGKTFPQFNDESIARYYASELKQPAVFDGKYFYYDRENDQTKSIDLEWGEPKLLLTGNDEIDKKRKSDYKGKMTSRQTELGKMWELGLIDDEQYMEQYMALDTVKDSLTEKKGKKVTVPKFNVPDLKIKVSKPQALSSSGGVKIDTSFESPSDLRFRSTL